MDFRRLIPPVLLVLVWSSSFVGGAQAQPVPPTQADKAAAESLFDQAGQLIAQKKYAEACRKLEDSQKLDPAVGTLLNLALCYEKSDRPASAWATYREAAAAARAAGQADRERKARAGADALESQLPRMLIQLKVPGLAGLEVRRDGTPVPASLWGTPTPVDPGDHEIQVTAPGYQPWTSKVALPSGGTVVSVEIPALVPQVTSHKSPEKGDSAESPRSPGSSTVRPGPGATEARHWRPTQTAGVVVGGLGVVGLALGGYFGLRAQSRWSDAKESCPGLAACPNGEGPRAQKDASTMAQASTIAIALGGVALAGGITLWVLAPGRHPNASQARLTTYPSSNGMGLRLEGTWQ